MTQPTPEAGQVAAAVLARWHSDPTILNHDSIRARRCLQDALTNALTTFAAQQVADALERYGAHQVMCAVALNARRSHRLRNATDPPCSCGLHKLLTAHRAGREGA